MSSVSDVQDVDPSFERKKRPVYLPLIKMLPLLVVVAVMHTMAIFTMYSHSDYQPHIESAKDVFVLNFANKLYHYFTYGLHVLLPFLNIYRAGIIVGVLSSVMLAGILATSLYRQMRASPWTAALLSFGLMLSAPIILFTLDSGRYFGYQHAFAYHSPTTSLMRPFAVIVFLYAAYALLPPVSSWWSVANAALMTALTINAKPNYSIAFLPAAGLIMAWRWLRRLFVDYRLLGVMSVITVLFLAFQYLTAFDKVDGGSGISIKPLFILMTYHGLGPGEIFIRQALSIMFPVVVLVLYWRTARHDIVLMFAWLVFLIGWFYALMMVEDAFGADHNFYWSGEIGLFILFFATVHFWIRAAGGRFDLSTWRARLVMGVWGLHLISGLIWYGSQLTITY